MREKQCSREQDPKGKTGTVLGREARGPEVHEGEKQRLRETGSA